MPPRHVLLVDDDPAGRDRIGSFLSEYVFDVSAIPHRDAARLLSGRQADLILIDLGHHHGPERVRELLGMSEAPVIVITGDRNVRVDKIGALECGADDSLCKPFGLRELVARIRAVLRGLERAETRWQHRREQQSFRFLGWELDMRVRRLTAPDRQTVKLTPAEFNLLVAFARAPQRVLSREQLIAACCMHDDEVFDRAIDVQVLRLRRKLEQAPGRPKLINTERGFGYIFTAAVDVG